MVYDITCLVDRYCYQHFRGIFFFSFRTEASGSWFLERVYLLISAALHRQEIVLSIPSSKFSIKFVTPSNINPELNCINRNEKLQTANHNDVYVMLLLHVSAFIGSPLQAM
jgi:hypothetical protein